jgi:hypothetical protein
MKKDLLKSIGHWSKEEDHLYHVGPELASAPITVVLLVRATTWSYLTFFS